MLGLLNVDKPPRLTSRDAVNRVQRLFGKQVKVGHAGTLDPLATGVLVLCVGRATRLIEFVQRMPKAYQATFELGVRSDSDDTESPLEAIAGAAVPTQGELLAALPQFLGEVMQVPPAYSAVKIAGRRAYKLARAGETPQVEPRRVRIDHLQIEAFDYPQLKLSIECGSGTYVRSLGRDLATAVGTGAVMSALTRTAIGVFALDSAVQLAEISRESFAASLLDPAVAVAALPSVELDESQLAAVRNGKLLLAWDNDAHAEYAAFDGLGTLAAVLRRQRDGRYRPSPNFSSPE